MNKTRFLNVRIGDIAAIALLFILSLGVILFSYLYGKNIGTKAIVTIEGKKSLVLSLDEPSRVSVKGHIGDTIIEVDERGVFVVSSPCTYKYCIKLGHVQREGQTIVCAPNHISIRIVGGNDDGLDGVTG
ncbi:MAG: NusG domain II-containing protein [Candidatus Electryonea clarkiae]|nr:NusG domain II-containing protein [Candidatus Electryonea clarkiae]MDP8286411.1 NusG domain II-containing protein [Candidatus Electryonea clarkiae]